MASVKKFEDLEIWQMARVLCHCIHDCYYNNVEFSKDYKLVNQINAASGSIMDNIAEGFERNGNRELINFLSIAKGSAGEVRSQLYRAYDRKYIDHTKFNELCERVLGISSRLGSFMTYLKRSDFKGPKFS